MASSPPAPSPEEALAYALLKLSRREPFFSTLAFYLNPEFSDNPTLLTAATDGLRVWLNRDFFSALNLSEQTGLLLHEVMHIAFEHVFRRGDRDAKRWNIACDFVVNQMIKDAGGAIPKGSCLDSKYKDLLEEEVYARLPKGIEKKYPDFMDLLEEALARLSPDEREALRVRVRGALMRAAHATRMIGKLPAAVERYLDLIRQPEQDWRVLLAEYLTALQKSDYDWLHPNRHGAALGIVLPGLRSVGALEHAAVVVDTSGSIGDAELAYFIGEILDIVDLCYPRTLTILPCDAEVYPPLVFDYTPDAETVLTALRRQGALKGGGGTDMPAALDWIERAATQGELLSPPAVVLVMTDGHTPFGEPREYPVVWCITDAQEGPDWGHVIRMRYKD
ncbi:MAG: VWA-like domain-containing protein [Candidatus Accumulibacter sp.]|jgi:predicted metal-dependent peptidase|nr:VWA-like domain-containing protein [Accumulibacter sp.]